MPIIPLASAKSPKAVAVDFRDFGDWGMLFDDTPKMAEELARENILLIVPLYHPTCWLSDLADGYDEYIEHMICFK